MSELNKYNIKDLIDFSIDHKPVDFAQAFTNLLGDKIKDAYYNKKIEIAQSIFGKEIEVNTKEDQDGQTT